MLTFIIFAFLVAVFVIIIAMQPADFRVSRSATLSALPAKIFEQVNDLHKWDAWSPWAKLDPNAKNSFAGPPAGVGASMDWEGNMKVGVGRMTITESRPNDYIKFKLDFIKPMRATNTVEFTFRPEGGKTTVTWSMSGTNNFIGKAMGLIFNCEKMVGGQFEKGLSSLKSVVEA